MRYPTAPSFVLSRVRDRARGDGHFEEFESTGVKLEVRASAARGRPRPAELQFAASVTSASMKPKAPRDVDTAVDAVDAVGV